MTFKTINELIGGRCHTKGRCIMSGLRLKSIPFKSLPAPVLRLMPVIFEYMRLTGVEKVEVGPVVRDQYVAHVRVLKTFLRELAKAAHLTPGTAVPLMGRCDSLVTLRGTRLVLAFASFVETMQSIYAAHRERIRGAVAAAPHLYRELYLAKVHPKRVLVVYAEDTWAESKKIKAKLTAGCWYDHRRKRASQAVEWLHDVDVVLFAPGLQPIRPRTEEAVVRAGLPLLVLVGWSKPVGQQDLVTFRTEYWYQQSRHHLLHGPFVPVRLYQAIDELHLHHLARQHVTSSELEAALH
jgi:hypothetical protein